MRQQDAFRTQRTVLGTMRQFVSECVEAVPALLYSDALHARTETGPPSEILRDTGNSLGSTRQRHRTEPMSTDVL